MRVVIAEDSVVLRDGLVRMLTARGHEVVGEVGSADDLLAVVERTAPDVAIVDVRMPPTHTEDGLLAAINLRRSCPKVGVLVFSQYVEVHHTAKMLAAGAGGVGYLLKDRVADVKDFVEAVQQVASGGTVLDPEIVTQLLQVQQRSRQFTALTPREREVLALMAEGRSNVAIAKALTVTPGAVEKYVTNIFLKLDLPATTQDHRRVLAVLRFLEG
ncbi:response regulator [Micromonospora siamensis]|nr:response regulator transcription factor [Micromonospora siamensis]